MNRVNPKNIHVAAVVVAAGQSRRMGQPKLIMPWGKSTVIGKVVNTITEAGVDEVVIVTGGFHQLVEDALKGFHVHLTHNPDFATNGMLESLQIGIKSMPGFVDAVLVVLGDQPQMESSTVNTLLVSYQIQDGALIVPSYKMRRGHPWLVDRKLWGEIQSLSAPKTLRDFLNDHADDIHYLPIDTPSILLDLDTPEDYQNQKPG